MSDGEGGVEGERDAEKKQKGTQMEESSLWGVGDEDKAVGGGGIICFFPFCLIV